MNILTPLLFVGSVFVVFCILLFIRVLYVLRDIQKRRKYNSREFSSILSALQEKSPVDRLNFVEELNQTSGHPASNINTLAVLGSGGHTTELLHLLGSIQRSKLSKLTYIVAETDITSTKRADTYEQKICNEQKCETKHDFLTLPRSREVGQSYLTSIYTTLYAFYYALFIIHKEKPDLILVNGPGTCIPICYAAFFLRVFDQQESSIIFIESFARVKSLSLTGKLLYPIASRFLIQWPQLSKKYPQAEYIGTIC